MEQILPDVCIMIDFEDYEKYLVGRTVKRIFFRRSNVVNLETVQKLRNLNYSKDEIKHTFEPTNGIGQQWTYEIICVCCQQKCAITTCKTKMLEHIFNNKKVMCLKCEKEEKDLKRKEITFNKIQNNIDLKKNTQFFIENFLCPDPEHYWPKDYTFWDRWNDVSSFRRDRDVVAVYIQEMKYKDFLKTPYWRAISEKKRHEAKYRCQMCNSEGILNVHHRTYDIHGYEMENMKDLIVLCDDCHKKHHDIDEQ
jgi:hypothetical protein